MKIVDFVGSISVSARKIAVSLEKIAEALTVGPASTIEFWSTMGGQTIRVKQMQAKVTDTVNVSLAIKDVKGNDAPVDGAPSWTTTDPALGSLTVAADGMSASFSPSGPVGSLKVQVSADADLGAGVVAIAGELDLDLLPGDAVSVSLSGVVA